jgi:hypothetical protein
MVMKAVRQKDPAELRRILFLVGNGDIPAYVDQGLYELAWEAGIRALDESSLKPPRYLRRRRRAS